MQTIKDMKTLFFIITLSYTLNSVTSSSPSSSTTADFEQFGQKLFSTVSQTKHDENVFLSPASITLAMSMCAVGARRGTLNQMLHSLEALSTEELTKTAEQVMRVFSIASQDQQVQLKLVNRLYIQKAYSIEQQYLNIVHKSFQSDVQLEDFKNESAKAVQTINTWVESQTNKRISNILSSKDVTSNTRLILINSIYFKAQWQEKFRHTATDKNADFHEANGVTSKIELMYQKDYHDYAENKDLRVQIAHLPYKSSSQDVEFVFTVVLPNEGVRLDKVERKLTSNLQLRQQVLSNQNAISKELFVYLPKFKVETKYELKDVLIKMGMEDAFSNTTADFGGIIGKVTDNNRILISKVIHKTFLNVNEEGTEAATTTTIIMGRDGSAFGYEKPQPIEFKANRPFLFFIREAKQDLVLFSGKFVSPSSSKN